MGPEWEEYKSSEPGGEKRGNNRISIPVSTVRRIRFDSGVSIVCRQRNEQKTQEKNLEKRENREGKERERERESTMSCTCVDIQTISIKRNCLYNESILVFLSFDPFLLASLANAEIFIPITILLQCV